MTQILPNFAIPNSTGTATNALQDIQYNFSGNTQYLFNRYYNLTIGIPSSNTQYSYNSLRIKFDIQKTSDSHSNKAKFEVYNLSGLSRKNYVKGVQVQFVAGYQGLFDTLFFGSTASTPTRVQTKREGDEPPKLTSYVTQERHKSEIVTTFELGDGESPLYNGILDKSFPPGTPAVQIIRELAEGLGLTISVHPDFVPGVYNGGLVVTGSIRKSLDAICLKANLQWNVQNGAVQIYPRGQSVGGASVLLNKNTGLIDTPSMGTGGDNIVIVKSLLNPKLIPGAGVILSSEIFNGAFTVRTSHFEGDTHSSKWQVTCECAPGTPTSPGA